MDKPVIPTLEQISAGGVVYRRDERNEAQVAIVAVNPSGRWQLPKGLIDAGETEEQAARREVREETGLDGRIVEKIETVEYWYYATHRGARVRFHKLVHFFLLEYLSGETTDHDHEIREARWTTPDDAVERLSFKSEKAVVEKAAELIARL